MIVGLCGLARSGKDTVAAHLVATAGYRRIAFADAMRSALLTLDPFVQLEGGVHLRLSRTVDLYGWDRAKGHPDVRRLLQRFGTEVGRNLFGTDVWVDLALDGVEPGERIVATDVRFANEAAAIVRLGGIVVEVQRPGAGLAGTEAAHASEAMDFGRHAVIVNDGTLDELHAKVDDLLGVRTP